MCIKATINRDIYKFLLIFLKIEEKLLQMEQGQSETLLKQGYLGRVPEKYLKLAKNSSTHKKMCVEEKCLKLKFILASTICYLYQLFREMITRTNSFYITQIFSAISSVQRYISRAKEISVIKGKSPLIKMRQGCATGLILK
jgi:hypothetical protein